MNDPVSVARSHSLADLLRRTAARYPDKTALIDGSVSITYAEFDRAVSAVAGVLLDRGLAQGDRVALLARNSWQFAVISQATARAGLVLVPVNFMLKADEVAFILEHSGAVAVIADEGALQVTMAEALATAGVEPVLRGVICGAESGEKAPPEGWENTSDWVEAEARELDVLIGDDDPVRIMYTSGTESRPKGALLSSRSLISEYVTSIVDGGMTADDIDLHTLPLYHCAQLDCFLGPDIYLGATSIILPAPDPAMVLRTIEMYKVTKYFAPPTVWIGLLRHPEFDTFDLSSLVKGYYGASPMPVEVLREIQQRLPNLRLWNFYGQTEMAPVATVLPPEDQVAHAGSAGRPALNVETRVVDDFDNPLPPGEVGEVVHRSPHATLGYYNDPEKTAAAFAGGWFHSGDLGVMGEDGRLTIVDRKKDMIKSGGENVASREVEEAIYEHPDVAEVAVFALPDPRWVEAVTAAVVLKQGATTSGDDIRAYLAERIAAYKVPKAIHIRHSLPKNPSGKILKRTLRADFAENAPQ